MIKINNTDISNIKVGDQQVDRVYAGQTVVWQNGGPGPRDYVQSGLVFQLDGVDKGTNSGYWTDLIDGVQFQLHQNAVVNSNNVQFNNSPCVYNGKLDFDTSVYNGPWTIECCIQANSYNPDFQFVLYPGADYLGMINIRNTGSKYCIQIGGGKWSSLDAKFDNNPPYSMTFTSRHHSADHVVNPISDIIINGQYTNIQDNTGYAYDESDKTILGAQRSTGEYPFNGKIYSIRIYNRLLTDAEVAKNQQLDIQRFGLDIPSQE